MKMRSSVSNIIMNFQKQPRRTRQESFDEEHNLITILEDQETFNQSDTGTEDRDKIADISANPPMQQTQFFDGLNQNLENGTNSNQVDLMQPTQLEGSLMNG
mmetsp:Transcript_11555/g.19530  ORF Transcript_11555/g.19530 Transcript_11555/m.19530 type:complete len:102 (+) Transcript_11555:334-639(+)